MSVFQWVELDLFSLKCNEVSSNEVQGIYEFGMALNSPSFNVQGMFLFCLRVSMVCVALDHVCFCVELDFSL